MTPQQRARNKVAKAIRAGRMVRPESCTCLGCPQHEGPCKGLGKPEAHHPDHSKPYEVVWLCNPCHKMADGRTKTTHFLVITAHRLRKEGLSYAYIARRLEVSERTVRELFNGNHTHPRAAT